MKKYFLLWMAFGLILSCKTAVEKSKSDLNNKPTAAYNKEEENMQNGFFFRGIGNEPEWDLKISETEINFKSLKEGFESIIGNPIGPDRAMDANVKRYRVVVNEGTMTIQIQQQDCENTMSGEKMPYTVQIKFENSKTMKSIDLKGCGYYVTDYRLNDIWVLEKMNGKMVSSVDFPNGFPSLEINSKTNMFMGFAGCNNMSGSLFFEQGLLRFTNAITTRKSCAADLKESAFLKALNSTTSYRVENLRLTLKNPALVELVFKKVD